MNSDVAPRPALIVPSDASSIDQYLEFARCAGRLDLRRLWLGQYFSLEPHQIHAHLAGRGVDVPAGTAVTLMPLRTPLEAVVQARSLATLSGRPYVAGFGPGAADFVRAMRGEPFSSPLTAVREYLAAVRGFLDGDGVAFDGVYNTIDFSALPAVDHPPIELGVGVLRSGMAHVAGELADVAITWMAPPDYIHEVIRPGLAAGASAAGRSVSPRIAAVVHVAVDRDGRDAHTLAYHAAFAHLSQPHYAAMLRRAGLPVDQADPAAGARALVNFDVFATGSPRDVALNLARYRRAGVDEVVLNPCGVLLTEGVEAALRDVADITRAVRDLEQEPVAS